MNAYSFSSFNYLSHINIAAFKKLASHMKGLMMDYQLTLPTILRRAESLFGKKEIVSKLPDKSIHRYTYTDLAKRAKKLAVALQQLGIKESDRVATLSWNHYQHLEAYFAVPCIGAVIHPLNIRLSADDLAYIINHAEDKIVIVDQILLPLFEKFKSSINVSQVIVIPQTHEPISKEYLNYEDVVASGDASLFKPFEGDVLLPIVPMFHASAWGFPYSCTFVGATQVFPGPHLDAESLLQLFEREKVTVTAGVPTVMMSILNKLDNDPNKYKLSLRTIVMGGSAMPRFLVKAFDERYNIQVLHSWGMTEMSPLGATANVTTAIESLPKEEYYNQRAKQGLPAPFVEVRGRNEDGFIPWDGVTMGELEVRGPWVCSSYYNADESTDKFTDDGWLKTGDVVTIDENGYIEIKDRSKDLIKSGGEWISSVALENYLMAHHCVLEAAVIAVPDERWIERPFAYVVLKEGTMVSFDELKEFLSDKFAKFWIPNEYAFIEAIPKTSVGKFLKSALRERYQKENTR